MKRLTISALAALVAKREGKKKSLGIGQISEVVGIVCDLAYKNPEVVLALLEHGRRRYNRRKKGRIA